MCGGVLVFIKICEHFKSHVLRANFVLQPAGALLSFSLIPGRLM